MCNDIGLTAPSKGEENTLGWYSATTFDGDNTDGIVDGSTRLLAGTVFGADAGPNVIMGSEFFDDTNGTQDDVNVTLTGSERPTTVDVQITPDPWLLYDANDLGGYPHYRLRFIGQSAWIGVGGRGDVGEATSSQTTTRRMNW